MESKNNCRTNSHYHWYSHCASVLSKHTVLYPFIYCLVKRQQRQLWSIHAEEHQDCAEPWGMDWDSHVEREPLPSCANTPVCRDPVCHSSSACIATLEKYTLWSWFIPRFRWIVHCSSLDVGPRKSGSWALLEACFNRVASPSESCVHSPTVKLELLLCGLRQRLLSRSMPDLREEDPKKMSHQGAEKLPPDSGGGEGNLL